LFGLPCLLSSSPLISHYLLLVAIFHKMELLWKQSNVEA
jgi:hypothetical protein